MQVRRNTLHQVFSGGGEEREGAHTWWTVPAQEMLLCSLPGAGGHWGAEPEPRDQRESPTADVVPGDGSVAHYGQSKPSMMARVKKTWKQTNQNKENKVSKGNELMLKVSAKKEDEVVKYR